MAQDIQWCSDCHPFWQAFMALPGQQPSSWEQSDPPIVRRFSAVRDGWRLVMRHGLGVITQVGGSFELASLVGGSVITPLVSRARIT